MVGFVCLSPIVDMSDQRAREGFANPADQEVLCCSQWWELVRLQDADDIGLKGHCSLEKHFASRLPVLALNSVDVASGTTKGASWFLC